MNTKFPFFVKELFLNPAFIFKKQVKGATNLPPFYYILICVYGISGIAEGLNQQFLNYDLRGNLDMLAPLNKWSAYWGACTVFGFLSGWISYYIGGWFFYIRIKLAKGDLDIQTSRNTFLYSRFIYAIAIFFITVIKTFTYTTPYNPYLKFTSWELAFYLISITFMYHSCYVGYVGVRTLTNADKSKSILWFIILPMLLFLFSLFSLFSTTTGLQY